ncbi:MAG: peptidylprolyl isomerase, partial [Muribaculaceae bacterium]|nr:peptidylprolyl isomerase [Muribaculaceae bacterium]
MKKKFITICFICIALIAFAKNIVEEIAWVVGDEPIYKSEIEEQYMQLQSEREAIDGDPYCVIPERMAIEKLFLHQAKIDTILPNETMVNSEVDARLNELINSYGSREKVEEYLRKTIPEIKETMRQYVRNRYTVQQVQSKLTENVKATPADVRKFYSTLSEDEIQYIPRQVVVKIITINPIIPASE